MRHVVETDACCANMLRLFLGLAKRTKRTFTVYLPDRPVLSRYYYTLSNSFNTKVDCSRCLTLDSLPIAFSYSMSSAYAWVELHVPPMPI